MSVLPSSATFWSFFVVLVAFLIGTALTAFSLKPIAASIRAKVQIEKPDIRPSSAASRWLKPQWVMFILNGASSIYNKSGLRDYVQSYVSLVRPVRQGFFRWADVLEDLPEYDGLCRATLFVLFILPFLLVRTWPRALVREALTREVMFLRDQYYLHAQLERNVSGLWWSPLALIRDVFRVIFVPVWIVLIAAIIGLLVVEDILLCILGIVVLVGPHVLVGGPRLKSKKSDCVPLT